VVPAPATLDVCDEFNADLVEAALNEAEQLRLNRFLEILIRNPFTEAFLSHAVTDKAGRFEAEISPGLKFAWLVQRTGALVEITGFSATTVFLIAIRRVVPNE
jgi:hypothetical protein